MHAIRRFFSHLGGVLSTILGGLYLIALYVFTIWLVVGSLSAIQVRDALEANRARLTQESIGRAQEQLLSRERSIIRALEESNPIAKIEDQMTDIAKELHEALKQVSEENAGAPDDTNLSEPLALMPDLNATEVALPPPGANLSDTFWFSTEEFMRSYQYLDYRTWCRGPDAAAQADDDYWKNLCKKVEELEALDGQMSQLYQNGEHEVFAAREAEALAQIDKMYDDPLIRFLDVYYFFQIFPLYVSFLHEPREILVMQLTIVMGMLGSVITMTWSFVRRDTGLSLRRFLILPFVGSMSAFIILVFLKAGQLTLTAGEATDALSPFFLSFVGIISGLLSERAYARISEIGNNFFSVSEDVTRWGINLAEAVRDAGLSVAELAAQLRVTEPEARDILAGTAGVGPLQQRLIAAWLRKDARLLFTDQPPSGIADMPTDDEDPPAATA